MSTAGLAVDGLAAPPRSNGELVFAEPWESRAFGVALSLHQAGAFAWEDFQAALITAIEVDVRTRPGDRPYSYYRCWLQALETLLVERGLVIPEQLDERMAEQLARPAGHDHGHDHGDHGHG